MNRLVDHPFEVLKGRHHLTFMLDHFLHQIQDLQVNHPSLVLMAHLPSLVLKDLLPSLEDHPSLVLRGHHHLTFMKDHFLHQIQDLQVNHPSLAFQDQKDRHLPSKVHPFYRLPSKAHPVHLVLILPSSAIQDPTLLIPYLAFAMLLAYSYSTFVLCCFQFHLPFQANSFPYPYSCH